MVRVDALPWAPILFRRCRAALEPNETGHYGRCELRAGHYPAIDHALERGLEVVRWQTKPRIELAS